MFGRDPLADVVRRCSELHRSLRLDAVAEMTKQISLKADVFNAGAVAMETYLAQRDAMFTLGAAHWADQFVAAKMAPSLVNATQLHTLMDSVAASKILLHDLDDIARRFDGLSLTKLATEIASPWIQRSLQDFVEQLEGELDDNQPAESAEDSAPSAAHSEAFVVGVLATVRQLKSALARADYLAVAVAVLLCWYTLRQGDAQISDALTGLAEERKQAVQEVNARDLFQLSIDAPVRNRPSGRGKKLASLRAGQHVMLRQSSGAWCWVEFADENADVRLGWVFCQNLSKRAR